MTTLKPVALTLFKHTVPFKWPNMLNRTQHNEFTASSTYQQPTKMELNKNVP